MFSTALLAIPLRPSREVNLSRTREIPTVTALGLPPVLMSLRMARCLQPYETDEVARNGVLQRITSARGFL
jgi:hypothetical protein